MTDARVLSAGVVAYGLPHRALIARHQPPLDDGHRPPYAPTRDPDRRREVSALTHTMQGGAADAQVVSHLLYPEDAQGLDDGCAR